MSLTRPEVKPRTITLVRTVYEDLQVVKQMKTSAIERIVAYHPWKEKGIPRGGIEGKRRTPLLDWISCQLCYQRPIQTKQLFLYGPTNTKIFSFTFFPRQLGFPSSGQTDFTGAHDHSDLWLFDDFDQTEAESGALAPTELSSSAKSLLKILSGKECRLFSKDARIFHKKRNVPVVLIANQLPLPRSIKIPERFILMHFQQHIHELKESRVIATLWACTGDSNNT